MTLLMDADPPGVVPDSEEPLSSQQRSTLILVAREAVAAATRWEERDPPSSRDPRLKRTQGAFVTLYGYKRKLRGCIGYVESHLSLIETVSLAAHAAASGDPRFLPVNAAELGELEIEISVLSPLRLLEDHAQLEIGKHGLVITDGAKRGLLLPQVAKRQGWDAERFLEETCRKAGLPANRWREPGVRIEIFTAEIVAEQAPGSHC